MCTNPHAPSDQILVGLRKITIKSLKHLDNRAAYQFMVFIENRYLRFNRYTVPNVRVLNKISNFNLRRFERVSIAQNMLFSS